jgi:hypothetical protein
MLDRESQSFDLKEVWLAQQTIEIDAQHMVCVQGVKLGAS